MNEIQLSTDINVLTAEINSYKQIAGQSIWEIGKRNTSGIKGVSWNKQAKKWDARIRFQNKQIYLGYYDNLEDAAKARKEAEEKYFKPILEKYGKED